MENTQEDLEDTQAELEDTKAELNAEKKRTGSEVGSGKLQKRRRVPANRLEKHLRQKRPDRNANIQRSR